MLSNPLVIGLVRCSDDSEDSEAQGDAPYHTGSCELIWSWRIVDEPGRNQGPRHCDGRDTQHDRSMGGQAWPEAGVRTPSEMRSSNNICASEQWPMLE